MNSYINSPFAGGFQEPSPSASSFVSEHTISTASHADSTDFQVMVDGEESGESWSSVHGVSQRNGIYEMVGNVESAKGDAQSALLTAATSPDPESMFRATAALSRYDLQTLFLSKVANKAFQAVDRLTNLQ